MSASLIPAARMILGRTNTSTQWYRYKLRVVSWCDPNCGDYDYESGLRECTKGYTSRPVVKLTTSHSEAWTNLSNKTRYNFQVKVIGSDASPAVLPKN